MLGQDKWWWWIAFAVFVPTAAIGGLCWLRRYRQGRRLDAEEEAERRQVG